MNQTSYNEQATSGEAPRFKGEILTKIYRVWLFRKLLPVLIGEIVVLSFILYLLGRTVFIQRILENMLNIVFISPPQLISFFVSAFTNASLLTKFLTLGLTVLMALLIRHLTQGILRLVLVRKNYFGRVDPVR